jgi:hypothetical protein
MRIATLALVGCLTLAGSAGAVRRDASVTLLRLPDGGIQPQAVVDSRGVVHAVYLNGEPGATDVFYVQLRADGTWTSPLRVNSQAGSAIATGSVRGAQLAVDGDGRPHVAWNGSSKAAFNSPDGATPMLYTRLNDGRTAFEPQRNLIQSAIGIDGGGAIAADAKGHVFVAWHAGGPDSKGEADRRVWLTISNNAGRTFAPERAISDPVNGACGCCGMDAAIDRTGVIYFLYRAARETVHRDSLLLTSTDDGRTFRSMRLAEWNVDACPMSTYSFAEGPAFMFAAWEAAGQVAFSRAGWGRGDQGIGAGLRRHEPPGEVRTRRHPSLATNTAGEILFAWTEGTAWQRGGSVAWQLFTRDAEKGGLKASGDIGHASGVPVWGLVAAVARGDGRFVIIY